MKWYFYGQQTYLSDDGFDYDLVEHVVWFHGGHVLVQYTDLLLRVPSSRSETKGVSELYFN